MDDFSGWYRLTGMPLQYREWWAILTLLGHLKPFTIWLPGRD
jgi:hypothetical protein